MSIAHNLTDIVTITEEPVDLVKSLIQHDEYLFVRVRDAASWYSQAS